MTKNTPNLNKSSLPTVLEELSKRRDAADRANEALNTYVLAIAESKHWEKVSYVELANALGCTRQAVQQRVARLLATTSGGRRKLAAGDHPGQTTIPLS